MNGGDKETRTLGPLRARQVLSQLSYTPIMRLSYWLNSSLKIKQNQVYFQSMWNFLSGFRLELVPCPKVLPSGRLPRKEVIQPQVLLRLPCYDFTPIADPTFGRWSLTVTPRTSGIANSHGVTGGVYKARERIHRDMLIRDY